MPQATENFPPMSTGSVGQQHSDAPEPVSSPPVLPSVALFLRAHPIRILAISAAVLAPCFWHRHIEAGDLASHTYNAWLAELIARGQAPGLSLARQWNNVLFDVTLSSLGNLVGLRAAEKITVAAAVLIFFWGAFALIAAAARRPSWFVLPCLAIFAYGWTFEAGLLNFFISLGLAFFGLALLWRGRGWEQTLVFLLAPLTWLAHPLGTALLLAAGSYLAISRILPPRFQLHITAAAAVLVLAARLYITAHYPVQWPLSPTVFFNGSDQLFLYGSRYQIPLLLFLAFFAVCLLTDILSRRAAAESLSSYRLPLQLYALALLAVWSLPSGIRLPQYPAPLSLLTERLTSICAVFACCLLSVMKPKKWHLLGFSLVAATFFVFLYQDTDKVDKMENDVEALYPHAAPGPARCLHHPDVPRFARSHPAHRRSRQHWTRLQLRQLRTFHPAIPRSRIACKPHRRDRLCRLRRPPRGSLHSPSPRPSPCLRSISATRASPAYARVSQPPASKTAAALTPAIP